MTTKITEDIKDGLRKQRAQLAAKEKRQEDALNETKKSIASLDAILESS